MAKQEILPVAHFLNRLVLEEMKEIETIDPFAVLSRFYQAQSVSEMIIQLEKSCSAALSRDAKINDNLAANLIYFWEGIEQLIEANFLIITIPSNQKKLIRKKKKWKVITTLNRRLTITDSEELIQFLHNFFSAKTLPEWKLNLHHWMEASISSFSVVEMIEPDEAISFYLWIEKLIEASFLVTHLGKELNSKNIRSK